MNAAGDVAVRYPRAYAMLSITLEGTRELITGIIPSRASVIRRSHNQAGTGEVTVLGSALPFDPRQIGGIFLKIYLASPATVDAEIDHETDLQFAGFVDDMKPKRDANGPSVELKARDMSSIFREFKPLPAAAVPRYSDTVGAAINRIVGVTTGASGHISLREVAGITDRPLARAARARTQGRAIQLVPDMNAWAAIEYVCGLAQLLVSVRLNEIVVREPTDIFGHTRPPVTEFIFGSESANLLSVEQTKKFVRNRRGVRAVAWDRTGRTRLEAIFPADSDLPSTRRPRGGVHGRVVQVIRSGSSRSSSHASTAAASAPPERDTYPAVGIHTQDELNAYAQRIYLERSHQEIEGKLVTPIWTDEVLGAENSDRFTLRIRPDLEAELLNNNDREARITLLMGRLDLTREAADALITAAVEQPTDTWYMRTITHEFVSEGTCTTSIDYLNLIQIEG